MWLARETFCRLSRRLEAGRIRPLLHLVERPEIVRPVYHFVKPQTTIYCAFLLGQAQYVDFILPRTTSDFAQASGLMMLKLAVAELARTQQLSGQLRGLVGECLGEDVVPLGQRLACLFPEALGLVVLLAASNGEFLVVDVAKIP